MAFSDLGSLGATGSTAANQSTLVLTTTATAAVGELVVVVIADDNRITDASDNDDVSVSSVADSAGNAWVKALGWGNLQTATQAGASVNLWYSVITTQLSSGGTITVTFADAALSDATGMTARHFSKSTSYVAVAGSNVGATDAADPASLDAVTPNVACLRIRGIAGEVGNNTSLTPTGSWTAWANGNSATSGTTAEMCARAEHIISTATGAASNPTWVSCDNASVYIAFIESDYKTDIVFYDQPGYTIEISSSLSFVVFPASVLSDVANANQIRFRFGTGTGTISGASISSAYCGYQGTANVWDFDGNQIQLFFNGGSASRSCVGKETFYTDWADFAFDGTKNLVIRFYVPADQPFEAALEYLTDPAVSCTYGYNWPGVVTDTGVTTLTGLETYGNATSGIIAVEVRKTLTQYNLSINTLSYSDTLSTVNTTYARQFSVGTLAFNETLSTVNTIYARQFSVGTLAYTGSLSTINTTYARQFSTGTLAFNETLSDVAFNISVYFVSEFGSNLETLANWPIAKWLIDQNGDPIIDQDGQLILLESLGPGSYKLPIEILSTSDYTLVADTLLFNETLSSANTTYARQFSTGTLAFNETLSNVNTAYARQFSTGTLAFNETLSNVNTAYARQFSTGTLAFNETLSNVNTAYARQFSTGTLAFNETLSDVNTAYARQFSTGTLAFNETLSDVNTAYAKQFSTGTLAFNETLSDVNTAYAKQFSTGTLAFNETLSDVEFNISVYFVSNFGSNLETLANWPIAKWLIDQNGDPIIDQDGQLILLESLGPGSYKLPIEILISTNDYTLVVDTLLFNETLSNISTVYDKQFSVTPLTYIVELSDVNFETVGYKDLSIEPLVFDLGLSSVDTITARFVTLDSLSFIMGLNDAALVRGRSLTAESLPFAMGLEDAALVRGRSLTAESLPFAMGLEDAALVRGRSLTAESLPFAMGLEDAALIKGRSLITETLSFSIDLSNFGTWINHFIATEPINYYTQLNDSVQTIRINFDIETNIYSLGLQQVTVNANKYFNTETLVYNYDIQNIELNLNHQLSCQSLIFNTNLSDVDLYSSYVVLDNILYEYSLGELKFSVFRPYVQPTNLISKASDTYGYVQPTNHTKKI